MFKLATILQMLSMPAIVGAGIFAAAGRVDLPMVWGVIGMLAVFCLGMAIFADPGMLRERTRPAGANRNRVGQAFASLLLVAHWILAGLDVGRFHWSPVPFGLQVAGLAGYAVALAMLFWTMRVNPFYSSVVRVQLDRGQHAVDVGPYRVVRHPGYTASLLAMLAGGMALGSWVAMVPILLAIGLFLHRTVLEDNLLRRELPGYNEYAQRVRYRLVPGVF